ncbi:MAG: DUF1934 domain-containing protein [Lachnospiraceae bacterium]|nr:DUF1934 domain-containing protein [Lachnospiraceae bacterium]
MESKKVILHIRGIQFGASWDNEEENGAIETVTTGILRKIGAHPVGNRESVWNREREKAPDHDGSFDGYYVIRYEEIQEGFEQTSSVLLKAAPGRLELTRKGLLNVRMEFADGEFTQSDYRTPFGDILFGFLTRRVTVDEQADGIRICASYRLEMNGEYLADSTIDISAEYTDN